MMTESTGPITIEEKRTFFCKHFLYEVKMLQWTYNELLKAEEQMFRNALIESFCIHARNLNEFFTTVKNKKESASDRAGATHFTDNNLKPYKPEELSMALIKKLNNAASHLSYLRVRNSIRTEGNDYHEIKKHLDDQFVHFSECLRSDFSDDLKSWCSDKH